MNNWGTLLWRDLKRVFYFYPEETIIHERPATRGGPRSVPMERIKKILVPLDFSPNSKNTLRYAIDLAGKAKARLVLFHAYHIPAMVGTGHHIAYPEAGSDFKKITDQQFDNLKQDMPALDGIIYETQAEVGFAVNAILEAAKTNKADLIVMGTHGASGIEEYLFGSNTAHVVKEAKCPVLAVPENAAFKYLHKIAFAYDYKGISDLHQLAVVRQLAKLYRSELQILNIKKSKEPFTDKEQAEHDRIDRFLGKIKHAHHLQVNDDVEAGIKEYLATHDIDLLVTMPRNHGFFEKVFTSSLSEKLAMHIKLPLLAIHE